MIEKIMKKDSMNLGHSNYSPRERKVRENEANREKDRVGGGDREKCFNSL